jgi:hypothetical protein
MVTKGVQARCHLRLGGEVDENLVALLPYPDGSGMYATMALSLGNRVERAASSGKVELSCTCLESCVLQNIKITAIKVDTLTCLSVGGDPAPASVSADRP